MALYLGCGLYFEGINDLIILHRRGLLNTISFGSFFNFFKIYYRKKEVFL